jgi:hypothetical protein
MVRASRAAAFCSAPKAEKPAASPDAPLGALEGNPKLIVEPDQVRPARLRLSMIC